MRDTIDRQAAIDAIEEMQLPIMRSEDLFDRLRFEGMSYALDAIIKLPSAQPTFYGYNIDHLAFVANVLAKENIPPERLTEVLNNTERIVAMVREEFENSLRVALNVRI